MLKLKPMSSKPITYAVLAALPLLVGTLPSTAQEKVFWGDEFKMHRGSTDLTILRADPSGIYLEETHEIRKIGLFGSSTRKSSILVKLTQTMTEQYSNDFDKELKGKEFDRLFFISDKLYLFATDNSKKDNSLYLYAVEVDKGTGNLKGDWQQVSAWEKLDKSGKIDYTIDYNGDSSNIVITGSYTGKDQNRYEIRMMDANLHPVGKPMTISNEFDPSTFQVQDFVYTRSGNAVLVGRIYEYEEGKKKKEKNLLFKNYNIRLYGPDGKMISELVTDIDNKFLVTGKVLQVKNALILAAFYSNERKKKKIDGLLVERLDPATGRALFTKKMDLTTSLISEVEDEDGARQTKKDDDEEEGLAANLVFRNFYMTPDHGLIILAEQYTRKEYISSSYVSTGMGNGKYDNSSHVLYNCGDIYMAKVSGTGNIDWLHVLPKNQYEDIQVSASSWSSTPGILFGSYFEPVDNRPFYGGFTSIAGAGTVHLFFNDSQSNGDVLQPGKRVKRVQDFGRSTCYMVDLDMITGKYTRKPLYSNKDIPTSMPRLGVPLNNSIYLTGKEDRAFAKSKIVVGKITCSL
jgi:hypothetical protein